MKYQSFWHFLVINRLISSISTVLEMKIRIKCTFYFHLYCKSRCFRQNLHRWQKFYTAACSDGIDKFHLWVSISQEFSNTQKKQKIIIWIKYWNKKGNAKHERLATSVERGRGVAENPWPSDAGLTHFDRSMINFYLAPILAFLLTNVN